MGLLQIQTRSTTPLRIFSDRQKKLPTFLIAFVTISILFSTPSQTHTQERGITQATYNGLAAIGLPGADGRHEYRAVANGELIKFQTDNGEASLYIEESSAILKVDYQTLEVSGIIKLRYVYEGWNSDVFVAGVGSEPKPCANVINREQRLEAKIPDGRQPNDLVLGQVFLRDGRNIGGPTFREVNGSIDCWPMIPKYLLKEPEAWGAYRYNDPGFKLNAVGGLLLSGDIIILADNNTFPKYARRNYPKAISFNKGQTYVPIMAVLWHKKDEISPLWKSMTESKAAYVPPLVVVNIQRGSGEEASFKFKGISKLPRKDGRISEFSEITPNSDKVTLYIGFPNRNGTPKRVAIKLGPDKPGKPTKFNVGKYIEKIRTHEAYLNVGKVVIEKIDPFKEAVKIVTPTAEVRDIKTRYSIEHDETTGITTVEVMEGEVSVTPRNRSLTPVTVRAGQKVNVSLSAISPVAPIGAAASLARSAHQEGGGEPTRGNEPKSQSAARKTVQVPANRAWTRTGVTVDPGTFFRIEASGVIEAAPPSDDRAFYHRVPPEGGHELHPEKPYPHYSALMLMGKFENGATFPVGRKMALYAGQTYGSGQLLLGINDNTLNDNSGAWNAIITVYGGRNTEIVGAWRWSNGGRVDIRENGTMSGGGGSNSGTWEWDSRRRVFILRWKQGGWVDTVTLSVDGQRLSGSNQQGTTVSATRITNTGAVSRPPYFTDALVKEGEQESWSTLHTHQGCSKLKEFCRSYPIDLIFLKSSDGTIQAEWKPEGGSDQYSLKGHLTGMDYNFTMYKGNQNHGGGTFTFEPGFKRFNGTWNDRHGHRGVWRGEFKKPIRR
ncbi:FecR family protein [bacterium]|nr:FecR family protein [bacterium]